ncbi:MAG: murein biosynthesis integral membrane protein MurJ [Planctomycetes bacterium]|nr:murein biosynthesis integral membrane protein MurJ [Planctomycetota bacterium]
MEQGSDAHEEHRHFFAAAKLIAGLTLCSRVAGLLRDMVLAWFLGASGLTSNFQVAFAIPNFFRRLFGEGALSASFVPAFSETLARQGKEQAAALLANVLGLLGLLLCVLWVLTEVALLVVYAAAPTDSARQLIAGYSAIMMPFMVTICLLALGSAALNCVGHFAYPAAAPIALNICIIIAAGFISPLLRDPTRQIGVVAVSVVVAGVVQLILLAWVLKAHNLPIRPTFRPIHPGVRRIAANMAPMLIPLGVLQINALLDKFIARIFADTDTCATITILGQTVKAPLHSAAVTWMYFGERLYQFPLGVLAISLATAVFPLLSRYAARGETENLRAGVNRAMRLAIFEGLPSGVGLLLLSGPLVWLFFRRGEYTSNDVAETAHVVWFYGLGMWAFCTQQVLLRAYYALNDRKTPLKVACSVVVINLALNLILIWVPSIRQGAFGLSTSITASLNVVILTWLLRRRLGAIGGKSLALSTARIALATAAMALVVWQAKLWLGRWGVGQNLYVIAVAVPAGIAVYLLTCLLLRAPEVGELFASRRAGDNRQ